MNADPPRAGKGVYAGLLLTTLSTLAYQLLLTRIFSVTMWYHYTFMAVSLAMFGMTVGAILVYLRPRWFAPAAAARRMGLAASCFAVLIVLSFLVHLRMHFPFKVDLSESLAPLGELAANYALLALPFVASGVCVTIALSRYPNQVGKLYAVDLIGAGLGCLLVAVVSRWIDAPTLILITAAVAALAALWYRLDSPQRRRPWLSIGVLLILGVLVSLSLWPNGRLARAFRPRWVKGKVESTPSYERWNAFSRIAVWLAPDRPVGWGMSGAFGPRNRSGNCGWTSTPRPAR